MRLTRRPPPFSRGIQLPVPLGEDRPVAAGQLVRGRHVTDRTVQADLVVMRHEFDDQASCILQAQGCLDPNTFALESLMPSLDLPITLGIVWRCPHMSH